MITVNDICDRTPSNVKLMDNGNGAMVLAGTPEQALAAGFGDRVVNYITVENNCLVLWTAHIEK